MRLVMMMMMVMMMMNMENHQVQDCLVQVL